MISAVTLYSLFVWFLFYLVNHAEITAAVRDHMISRFPRFLQKVLSCAICFAWWMTLGLIVVFAGFSWISLPFLFTAPPIVLLIERLYGFLNLHSKP